MVNWVWWLLYLLSRRYSRLVCNVVVEVRVLDYGYVAVVQVEHVPVLVGLALSHRREIWLLI